MTPNPHVFISDILKPLFIRRWKLLCSALFVALIISGYAALLKPTYMATATLQIGINQSNNLNSESNRSVEKVRTQHEILKSRTLAERVIKDLNLTEHEEFTSSKFNNIFPFLASVTQVEKVNTIDTVIDKFLKRLSILPIDNTELVKITFKSYSPLLSKKIVNSIGDVYLAYQNEINVTAKGTSSERFIDKLNELREKLEASEKRLQNYKEDEGIVGATQLEAILKTELTELSTLGLKNEKYKNELRVTHDYIQNNKGNIKGLIKLNEISEDTTFKKLQSSQNKTEQELQELVKKYESNHPNVKTTENKLKSIEVKIKNKINEIITSVEKKYLTALQKTNANKQRSEEVKKELLTLQRSQNKLIKLNREVNANQDLYNNYTLRSKAVSEANNIEMNLYARFIDKAALPQMPIAPNIQYYAVVSFILSFVLFAMIIILRELFVDTLNSRRKLENFKEASILAILPKFKLANNISSHSEIEDNQFIEAIRTLRTSLLFNGEKTPPKVIAVTSSVPNEGKSTVALHLARSFSEMEKVLLIEADLRHPTVAKNLNLGLHRPGLSNLLAKTHQINECIVRDTSVKLDILTSGISPANPLAFLSMKRFGVLIKVFSNFYDRIIIETPPVNAVSDAVIISKNVDSVIYVVHGTKTKREQITQGLRLLKQVNATIEGVVINQSENIGADHYPNKYYNDMANIIKLPMRKQR